MKQLTKEQAINYFNEKAPKALREKGIITIDEYAKGENKIFIINGTYIVRQIVPEAYNCFMRNQNFEPRISGAKFTKQEIAWIKERWEAC